MESDMPNRYETPFSQQHGQSLDYALVEATRTSPIALTHDSMQISGNGNIVNEGTPHTDIMRSLSRDFNFTTPQLETSAGPSGRCICHMLLNQIIREDSDTNRTSRQATLCSLASFSEHQATYQGMAEGLSNSSSSTTISTQPGMSPAGTQTCTPWQSSMPYLSLRSVPLQTSAQTFDIFTGTVSPLNSLQPNMYRSTPCAPAGLFDNVQQSGTDSDETASEPCESPKSGDQSHPQPKVKFGYVLDCPETPHNKQMSPACPPRPGQQAEIKIMMFDPSKDRLKKGKNKRKSKTPCPKCAKGFENRHELAKHTRSVHERSVEYICNHCAIEGGGDQSSYSKSRWDVSAARKHHSTDHKSCTQMQSQQSDSTECWQEVLNPRPIRQRGCWLCVHLSPTVEHWVDHHLGKHRACLRSDMSQEWVMQSLLSHKDIALYWQIQMRSLEVTSHCFWELKWPRGSQDATVADLITCLETGFFKDKDFHKDAFVRAQVAEAAMDATIGSREAIGLIPPQEFTELEAGLNTLRKNLAEIAKSELILSSSSRKLKRAASTSPLLLSMARAPILPWLQTPSGEIDLTFPLLGPNPGESWTSHLEDQQSDEF